MQKVFLYESIKGLQYMQQAFLYETINGRKKYTPLSRSLYKEQKCMFRSMCYSNRYTNLENLGHGYLNLQNDHIVSILKKLKLNRATNRHYKLPSDSITTLYNKSATNIFAIFKSSNQLNLTVPSTLCIFRSPQQSIYCAR